MQRNYLVTYDISDPVRLRKTHAVVRDFGDRLQYSVYLCRLTGRQRAELHRRLSKVVHASEDQVLFVDLGAVRGHDDVPVENVLGRPIDLPPRSTVAL